MRKWFVFIVMALLLTVNAVAAQESTPEATPEATLDPNVILSRDAAPDANSFRLVELVSGLFRPLYLTHAGDGSNRLFILEQTGRVWIVRDGALLNTPFIDLTNIVSQDVAYGYSERGLLGLAFHPNYAENGQFYVNYTDREGTSHVAAYTVSADNPDVADPSSARELLTVAQPYPNHNGGHLSFGLDGYLYISFGDGGSRDDPLNAGQTKSTLLGKILRIDVDNFDFDRPYGIPADNPFSVDPTFAPEVWAYGLRNVWRFSFDRATGDLYLGDVGENAWEEINFEPADSPGGVNYGWVAYEANERYRGAEPESPVTFPVATYPHSGGSCSVTGGYVYRGEAIPALQGYYFYSDYCSGNLWSAWRDATGTWQSTQLTTTGRQISSFGEDEQGELYLIDYNGVVLALVPAQ
ncbi:MAG: PQQ-dependent sugar dehydrogenase [bacterium]|nr:PQQ-dependent sugar dehydrogenase [bacterium]